MFFSFLLLLFFSPVQTDKKISIEHASHRKFTFPWLHSFSASLCLYCVCMCVSVWLWVLTSVLAREAKCVRRFVLRLSVHTLSSHIELGEDASHLLVQPADECCCPIVSNMLTKCNIGCFWAGSMLVPCISNITACCNRRLENKEDTAETKGLIDVGVIKQTACKTSASCVVNGAKWQASNLRLFDP